MRENIKIIHKIDLFFNINQLDIINNTKWYSLQAASIIMKVLRTNNK